MAGPADLQAERPQQLVEVVGDHAGLGVDTCAIDSEPLEPSDNGRKTHRADRLPCRRVVGLPRRA
jgi:hypothetical protein